MLYRKRNPVLRSDRCNLMLDSHPEKTLPVPASADRRSSAVSYSVFVSGKTPGKVPILASIRCSHPGG